MFPQLHSNAANEVEADSGNFAGGFTGDPQGRVKPAACFPGLCGSLPHHLAEQ